jgi:hypothetical protein
LWYVRRGCAGMLWFEGGRTYVAAAKVDCIDNIDTKLELLQFCIEHEIEVRSTPIERHASLACAPCARAVPKRWDCACISSH